MYHLAMAQNRISDTAQHPQSAVHTPHTQSPVNRSAVLYQNPDLVIAYKEHGMPTVPLKTQSLEGTLLGLVAKECPEILSVHGKNPWEGGTMHRLDTATAGLVVFARTQSFFDYLSDIQSRDLFKKTYRAKTEAGDRLVTKDSPRLDNLTAKGSPNPGDLTLPQKAATQITSYFRPFGPGAKEVRPTLDIKRAVPKVLYTTTVTASDNVTNGTPDPAILTCTITRGFRHQIRAHLAWTGHPIIGDQLYGTQIDAPASSTNTENPPVLELECVAIEFPYKGSRAFRYEL